MIAANNCIVCFLAAICFWNAGYHYAKTKEEQMAMTEKAIEKVSAYHVSLQPGAIDALMKMNLKDLTTNSYKRPTSMFYPHLSSE